MSRVKGLGFKMREFTVEIREILCESVTLEANTKEEAIAMVEASYADGKVECSEVCDVEIGAKENFTEKALEKKRLNNEPMKMYPSAWANTDKEVPYMFDLSYDIKTEAHLLTHLQGNGGEDIDYNGLLELSESFGYNFSYLEEKFSRGGRVQAEVNEMIAGDGDKVAVEIQQENVFTASKLEFYDTRAEAQQRAMTINDLSAWSFEELEEIDND